MSWPHGMISRFEKATRRLTGIKNVVAPRGDISFRERDASINGPRDVRVRPCGAVPGLDLGERGIYRPSFRVKGARPRLLGGVMN